MGLEEIKTDSAPAAVGPYSQAIVAGDYMFVSGQIPMDPGTGKLVEGDIKVQTARVLDNIEAILKTRGIGFGKVVKAEVYLSDIGNFGAMNEVYESRFTSDPKPARQAMEVANLPLGVDVEISCIAYLGD